MIDVMRFAVLVLAACSGGQTPSLDKALDRFIAATCSDTNRCRIGTQSQCEFQTRDHFTQIEPMLDEFGTAFCARCLVVRTQLVPALQAAGCSPSTEILMQELAVCDLDPTVDWDGDGDPANDLGQACATF